MKVRFVIWGAGVRGLRVWPHLSEYVDAFIDLSTEKQGKKVVEKPIISYEEYKTNYSSHYIVISYAHEQEIIDLLHQDGIFKYFLLTDMPGEYQTSNPKSFLKDYVKNYINKEKKYIIYGVNLYGFLVNQWIYEKTKSYAPMIFEADTYAQNKLQIERDFSEYSYMTQIPANMDEVLAVSEKNIQKLIQQNISVKNIYDCSKDIEEYYNKDIEAYCGIHKGKRCFIVATGPSLKMKDLDKLYKNNEICISMNGIWKAYNDTEWRPNYYIADDFRAIDEYEEQEDKFPEIICFMGDTSPRYWEHTHSKNILMHHFIYEYAEDRFPKFSMDFARQCYMASTVTYSCIQLAVYMGFSEIYLLGVDFTYGNNVNNIKYAHFFKEEKLVATGYTRQVSLAYQKARKFADDNGIKIYNATRGGKLEIFERVEFDKLFIK